MKELTNKKTGTAYIVNEEEFESLRDNGRLKKFYITDIEPVKKMIPTPGIIKPEVKVTKSKPKI